MPIPAKSIGPENVSELTPFVQWGSGEFLGLGWQPDGQAFIVLTTIGVDLYHADTFETIWHLDGEWTVFAFSPDSTRLALGSSSGRLTLFDTSEKRRLWSVETGLDGILALAFSHDLSRIASAYVHHPARLWSVARGEEQETLAKSENPDSYGVALAFSTDDSAVTIFRIHSPWKIYDADPPIAARRWALDRPSVKVDRPEVPVLGSGQLSLNGRLFVHVEGDSSTAILYDPESLAEVKKIDLPGTDLYPITFSDTGTVVAGASCDDRTGRCVLKVVDGATGAIVAQFPSQTRGQIWHLALAPLGDRLLVATGQMALLYATSGSIDPLWEEDRNSFIDGVAFAPDSEEVTILLRDQAVVTLGVPNLNLIREARMETGAAHKVGALTYSPDGRYLARPSVTSPTAIEIVDASSGDVTTTIEPGGWLGRLVWAGPLLSWAKPGVSSAGPNILLANMETGERSSLSTPVFHRGQSLVTSLALAPDGQRVAVAQEEWDFHGQIIGHDLVVWDIASDRQAYRVPMGMPMVWSGQSVVYSADGSLLAFQIDDAVQIIDAFSGRPKRQLAVKPEYGVSLEFSPDHALLAVSTGKPTQFWSVQSGQMIAVLNAESGEYTSPRFSPDGRWLVTTAGGVVTLWAVPDP